MTTSRRAAITLLLAVTALAAASCRSIGDPPRRATPLPTGILSSGPPWLRDVHVKDRFVVLEFQGSMAPELLSELAEEARVAAMRVLQTKGCSVLTREQMSASIARGAIDGRCREGRAGDCELAVSRGLGATFFISGEVLEVRGGHDLLLKLRETRTGRVLEVGRRLARSEAELLPSVSAATERMFL